MTDDRKRLVAKLMRFTNAVDALHAEMMLAAELDAGFDGGEWSGPAHERMFVRDCDAIAARLGFKNADVAYALLGAVVRSTTDWRGM